LSPGLGRGALPALLLGAFVVALAYGVALPILPFLLERRIGPGLDVGWHTGLLTATYTFALAICAPLWGHLSDRWQRRGTILIGLAGFAGSLILFAFIDSLVALYAGRFLSGAFAAAVVPVALATLADWAVDEEGRARHFAWLNIATIGGSLAGPAIGGMLGSLWQQGMPASGAPFLLVAMAALVTALVALRALPRTPAPAATAARARRRAPAELRWLLFFAFLAAWALGTFEVGLALRAESEFGLGPGATGLMFVECMLVMVLAQALVFNAWFPSRQTRRLLAPAFAVLAAALLLLWRAGTPPSLFFSVAGVAAAAGVLSPIIAFWVSLAAGDLQGGELGRQTSAASLGQAIGSAAGGLLFSLAWGGGAFILAAAFVLVGAAAASRVSRRLAALVPARARDTAG
jgi:MFS family permease